MPGGSIVGGCMLLIEMEVEAGVTCAGVVVEEGVGGEEGTCLLKPLLLKICFGTKCASNKRHFEADVWCISDNTAEAV